MTGLNIAALWLSLEKKKTYILEFKFCSLKYLLLIHLLWITNNRWIVNKINPPLRFWEECALRYEQYLQNVQTMHLQRKLLHTGQCGHQCERRFQHVCKVKCNLICKARWRVKELKHRWVSEACRQVRKPEHQSVWEFVNQCVWGNHQTLMGKK